jgi:hypothetical protein
MVIEPMLAEEISENPCSSGNREGLDGFAPIRMTAGELGGTRGRELGDRRDVFGILLPGAPHAALACGGFEPSSVRGFSQRGQGKRHWHPNSSSDLLPLPPAGANGVKIGACKTGEIELA